MPIVKRDVQLPAPLDMATGNLPNPEVEEAPGIFETIGAAFRTDNIIGSSLRAGTYDGTVDPNYNPWTEIAGTKYEQHWDAFASTYSREQGEALKRQIDGEEKDRGTLEAAGWAGILASIGSALVDPTILIPVGGTVKKIEGGYSILKSAANVGLTSAAAIGVQEAILQQQQELRTPEESLVNIGGGVLLGGLLGGGAAAVLGPAEKAVALRGADELITGEIHSSGSLSSAERTKITIDDLTVDGRDAQAVARLTQSLSPNLRLQQSPSAVARRLGQELSETNMYQRMNAEGRTVGPAVETLMRMDMNSMLTNGLESQAAAFKDMKRAGIKMRYKDFDEAIGRALRNGDTGENEYISRAAGVWRGALLDKVFDKLVAAGALEEGDRAAFAKSYFPRSFNKDFIVANRPEVADKFTAFMEGRIKSQYEAARISLRNKIEALEQRVNDLTLNGEQRAAVIEELTAARETADEAIVKKIDKRLEDLNYGFTAETPRIIDPDVGAAKIYKVDEALVRSLINDIQTDQMKINRAFADKWEIRHLGEDLENGGDFSSIARQISEDVLDRIVGTNYGDSSSVEPEYMIPIARGPVIERTLPIPDELLEKMGVLNNSATDVLTHYARVGLADAHLSERFGKPSMVDQFEELKREYAALREEAAKKFEDPAKLQKELLKLKDRENADVRDLRALRDLDRGTYRAPENASSFGKLARSVNHFNYIRSMGGVVISSLGDLYRPAMVFGLGRFMREGIGPLLTNLGAFKMSVKEARQGAIGSEKLLQHRMMSLAELGDPYGRGNPVERFLENLSRAGTRWNGIALWTDFAKNFTSVMAQNRVLDEATPERTLAFLGIDTDMRGRIMRQFAEHGEVSGTTKIANTERWTDPLAVQHFRAAVHKDVNSVIVTPGLGDMPLFSKTPTGRMLLQFRSFTFASHQKVLLRGLQEDKTNFLSGLVGMTSIGMLVSTLRALRSGEDRFEKFKKDAENPGFLIGEGLDNTGIFSIPIDLGNTVEKLTPAAGFKFNPIKTPLAWGGTLINPDAPTNVDSVKMGMVSPWGTILGPTGGLGDDTFRAAGGLANAAKGEGATEGQLRAATRLIPFNSYLGMREALQVLNEDSPYTE